MGATHFVSARVLGRSGVPGANDRIKIGVIGIGIRGKCLIGNVPAEGRIAAICDCCVPRMEFALSKETSSRFARPLARFRERDAESCATFQDYRKMLDRAKLDAVIIATCDHHHILAAVLACQAGLDVYLEKPLSLTVREGRVLADAVKKHKRVLQVGSQQRTMEMNRFGCDFIRNGGIGKVSLVQLPNYPGPMRFAGMPGETVPAGLDWDLFCGPTPLRPYNRRLWIKDEFKIDGRLWRGWDLWRSYSGHLTTNWGAHSVDMVQLALGMDHTGPVEVRPLTDGHTGEMRFCPVAMRYANGIEFRLDVPLGRQNNWLFCGERGKLIMHRNNFRTDPPDLVKDPPGPEVVKIWRGPSQVARPHIQNWLQCVRSRATPNAPVEAGHRTATLCHLVNIARELRRNLHWDPQRETFPGDDEANALLDRPRRKGFELPHIA